MRFRSRSVLCLLCFAVVSTISVVTGILLGWGLRVRHYNAADFVNKNDTIDRTLFVTSELLAVDPVGSTVLMNWVVDSDTCSSNCTPVRIFFDTNLLRLNGDDWDQNLTNKAPETPIFTWFPEDAGGGIIPIFRTTSVLFSRTTRNDSTLQNYPFDTYGAALLIWAVNDKDEIVNIQRSYTYGIAVGFQAESDNSLSKGTGLIADVMYFKRSSLIKAYAFIIVGGVWLITLTFIGSVMKMAFGYSQPREAFVIPIGTLFAVTSLRSSMPGAPEGFGAILDFVGILPCLAIITLTGVVLFAFMVISNEEVTDFEPPIFRLSKRKKAIGEDQDYREVEVKDYSQPPAPIRYSE